jgi:hypothetical protein
MILSPGLRRIDSLLPSDFSASSTRCNVTGGQTSAPCYRRSFAFSLQQLALSRGLFISTFLGISLVLARYFVQLTENKPHARAEGLNVVGRKRNYHTPVDSPGQTVQFGSMRAYPRNSRFL